MRRIGKSTLMSQIRQIYPGFYLNFDDERLNSFQIDNFQALYEIFIELFGDLNTFYFDEIQNIVGWEKFIRRLHDNGKKIYITGSNAALLSRELGTHLTGRYIPITLFPFSFKEFLKITDIKFNQNDFYLSIGKAQIKKAFNEYFETGGIPEYIKSKDDYYLKVLYENILYRDIMVRYNLYNEKQIKEIMKYVATNISNLITYNSIKNIIGLNSASTIKNYLDYFENSYLISLVNKFDYSVKSQIYSPKKCYVNDLSIANIFGFRFSSDKGRLLENLVYIALLRQSNDVFYYRNGFECDFLVKKGNDIIQAIQVCYELEENNKKREINGLIKTALEFNIDDLIIITYDNENTILESGKTIKVIPVWKWLLIDEKS
jgi:hypothetical protein